MPQVNEIIVSVPDTAGRCTVELVAPGLRQVIVDLDRALSYANRQEAIRSALLFRAAIIGNLPRVRVEQADAEPQA